MQVSIFIHDGGLVWGVALSLFEGVNLMIIRLNLIKLTNRRLFTGRLHFFLINWRLSGLALGTLEDFMVDAGCVIFLEITYRLYILEATPMFTCIIYRWFFFIHESRFGFFAVKVIVEDVLFGPLRHDRGILIIPILRHGYRLSTQRSSSTLGTR